MIKVRRVCSAKELSTAAKVFKECTNNSSNEVKTKHSLSQPSNLDVIVREGKIIKNLENVGHIDDFSSDSLNLNQVDSDGLQSKVYAEILYPFQANGPQELALEKGTLVQVIKQDDDSWWYGRKKYDDAVLKEYNGLEQERIENFQGWFPKDFVKIISTYGKNPENRQKEFLNDCDITIVNPPQNITKAVSSCPKNTEIMRDRVIKELLETEINYVKLLDSLVNGLVNFYSETNTITLNIFELFFFHSFIKEMKDRSDVFSLENIFLMFSNIEQIYRFQQNFLEALRISIPNERIAEVFLEFQSAFVVYSQYCNSYPRALMELDSFSNSKEAASILER